LDFNWAEKQFFCAYIERIYNESKVKKEKKREFRGLLFLEVVLGGRKR
jgi:hypothetical protein